MLNTRPSSGAAVVIPTCCARSTRNRSLELPRANTEAASRSRRNRGGNDACTAPASCRPAAADRWDGGATLLPRPVSRTAARTTATASAPGSAESKKMGRRSKRARSSRKAANGPRTAPAESMAWRKPKAAPRREAWADSASMASRGAVRTPFDSRSAARMASTWSGLLTHPSSGLTALATR